MGRDYDACWRSAGLVFTVASYISIRFAYRPEVAIFSRIALCLVGRLYDDARTLAGSMKRGLRLASCAQKFWIPMIASLIVTPIALLLGLASAGVGHGDYRLAMMLFPYTLLSTAAFDSITPPFILLAIVQFPLYGVLLGYANEQGRLLAMLLLLCVMHGLALTAMFLIANSNFS